jgi:hypothetical protein
MCGGTGILTEARYACGPGCTLWKCDPEDPHSRPVSRQCPGCADCRDDETGRKGAEW